MWGVVVGGGGRTRVVHASTHTIPTSVAPFTHTQSFGGFCIVAYLSTAPGGIKEAFLTGGLPPLVASPDAALPTYRKLINRVVAQNKKYYKRFPGDVAVVRDIASFLCNANGGEGVATPSGGKLSVRGLQALGFPYLGTACGFESLHYLLEKVLLSFLPSSPPSWTSSLPPLLLSSPRFFPSLTSFLP